MNKGGTFTFEGIAISMVPAEHSSGLTIDGHAVYLGEAVGFVIRFEVSGSATRLTLR